MPAGQGEQVVYGIRPEHVAIDPAGIEAEVTGVEPTGAETLLVTRLGGHDLTCLARDRVRVRPGEKIGLRPDPAKAHVFAASGSGDRLPMG